MVIFLLLVICTVAAAWPLLAGVLSKRRLLGTTAVVAILTLLAITNWSDLHNVQQQAAGGFTGGFVSVSAGSGLLLYTVGVVVLCTLIVRLWLFRRRAARYRRLIALTARALRSSPESSGDISVAATHCHAALTIEGATTIHLQKGTTMNEHPHPTCPTSDHGQALEIDTTKPHSERSAGRAP